MGTFRFELAFLQEEIFALEFDHELEAKLCLWMITFVRLFIVRSVIAESRLDPKI